MLEKVLKYAVEICADMQRTNCEIIYFLRETCSSKLTIIVKQLQTGIAQVSEVETGSMIGTFLFGYPL